MPSTDDLKNALLSVMTNVGHFGAVKKNPPYIVYAEYGGSHLRGDDTVAGRTQNVQVDYFTKTENDPVLRQITDLLDANEISYEEPITSYEKDTEMIHHIIDCEIEVD